MFRLATLPSWALIFVLPLTVLGCQTLQSSDGLLEQESSNAKVSSRQLRIVLDDLVLQYSSQVELAADQIIAENSDPQVRKNALLWKMNSIASCFQAASRRDPLGAYFDIWILNKQSLSLFNNPSDSPLFGESQGIAISATQEIETIMAEVLDLIGDDLPVNEAFVNAFAQEHPINDLYFKRASITANYTKYIDSIKIKGPELLGVVGDIDQQLDQIQRLSSMYAEFLPKQARWNGELMIMETLQSNAVIASLQNMSLAANGVATIADTTQTIPSLIERERNLLNDSISAERVATMEALEKMRSATLNSFQEERIAVMAQIESERDMVLNAVQEQRIAATQDLSQLGEQSLVKMDHVIDTKIGDIAKHGSDLIDHGFRRLVQLLVAVAALTLLFVMAFLQIRKHQRLKTEANRISDGPIGIHTPTTAVQGIPVNVESHHSSGATVPQPAGESPPHRAA
ncbi:MAG: hypothetical protein CMM01_08230 [Rhodopirellula sp.]|nr:hypothetical protein [Rhodopirellula sp.]